MILKDKQISIFFVFGEDVSFPAVFGYFAGFNFFLYIVVTGFLPSKFVIDDAEIYVKNLSECYATMD